MDIFAVYAGEKLGLYRSLHQEGPATPAELAARTGTHERYIREWLEQQATTGILAVGPSSDGSARRYSLPAGYEAVLVDGDSELFVAPVGRFVASAFAQAPGLLNAYRSGGGVPWEAYGEDMRTAQADFNRPFFINSLVPGYLSQVPGLDAALKTPGARVAEIGPGGGWAAIAIARGYPGVRVDGFDLDAASVDMARANVAAAGLSDRVTIHHRDAGDGSIAGDYDLVAAFECIHDVPDPVSVLRTMGRLVKPGGTVLVMDEGVGEEFGAIGDFTERLMYGFSLTVCLPDGMSHQPSAGTGTVMRPPVFRRYAEQAGFSRVDILPLEHDLFRFYALVP
ncbi:MAG: methyltransferase domain-containing protein [Chloroflexi bacterium]|nr:methyltransferase domain-containing protein [Chloroflexota bacterium]